MKFVDGDFKLSSDEIAVDRLKAERAGWLHRVTLMHSDTVDRDLASEEIRLKLGYVDPRDLVIFTDANRKR